MTLRAVPFISSTSFILFSLAFTNTYAAETSTTVVDSIKNGSAEVSLRYRFENVDQEGLANNADASTLKTRFIYTTAAHEYFKAQLEVDNVSVLGGDSHNDTTNGLASYPVVADPEGTDINQAWVAYTGIEGNSFKLGRQRVNFDNQRFVGGVGWRQNEQTYDAFAIVNTALADTTVVYSFVSNVNRIFGPKDGAQPAELDTSTHLLNINYTGLSAGTFSAYGYWLDVKDAPGASSSTLGLRFTGEHEWSDVDNLKVLCTAEYAQQSDYGDNPSNYDVDYYLFEAGVKVEAVTAKLGWEVLEGNASTAGQSFSTPLATLHKFNGWADKFLATPSAGLEDRYLSLSTKLAGMTFGATYHQFDAQDGPGNWGDEIDLSVAKTLNDKVKLLLKYADYQAEDFAADTQKIWLQAQVSF